jgi:hypothetical protein
MRIVFGHNHYCRKSVKLEELGILTPIENIKQFELTQRYAHLYWIPLFPIGLSWNARANDGKLYKISDALEQQLKHIHYSWASVLIAFIGPILLVAGLVCYHVAEMYHDYNWKVQMEKTQKSEYEQKAAFINNPSTEDYYHFSGGRNEYAKVDGFNDTALLLSASVLEAKSNNPTEVVALLDDSTRNFPPEWVSKNTLRKMINPSFDTSLFGLGSFHLSGMQRLGEPVLEYHFRGASQTYLNFTLHNNGTNLVITDIDKMKSDLDWDNALPDTCKYDDYLGFRVGFSEQKSPHEFAFAITCKDKKGKIFKYLVKGKGFPDEEVTLTRQL